VTALPAPGQTWYSRDGRVAQVFENETSSLFPLIAEYSNGVRCTLTPSGRGGVFAEYPVDLVRRSPWDKIRAELFLGDTELADDIWAGAFDSLGVKDHRREDEILSEALEFLDACELARLTPQDLIDGAGPVKLWEAA
jgi:hypothetical protein